MSIEQPTLYNLAQSHVDEIKTNMNINTNTTHKEASVMQLLIHNVSHSDILLVLRVPNEPKYVHPFIVRARYSRFKVLNILFDVFFCFSPFMV